MDVTPHEHRVYRPGGASWFFIYKAGFMAVACWVWLAVLTARSNGVSGWQLVAAAGAITTTLVGVVLGARHALAHSGAARHEQVMRTLVELSWQAFTPNTGGGHTPTHAVSAPLAGSQSDPAPPLSRPLAGPGSLFAAGPAAHPGAASTGNGGADIIRLAPDQRPRPRR